MTAAFVSRCCPQAPSKPSQYPLSASGMSHEGSSLSIVGIRLFDQKNHPHLSIQELGALPVRHHIPLSVHDIEILSSFPPYFKCDRQ
ncbi:uncharacterized protein TrAFT101_007504 [Trichoderma asperellum]|uniref:uncharacterized protein n=1 Tax=Trichoderma asperellum TaxID=101201 RepID=UPI0033268191|nr:hypothetical protein TrAFT101_007504 [Trichoderma asperellum]